MYLFKFYFKGNKNSIGSAVIISGNELDARRELRGALKGRVDGDPETISLEANVVENYLLEPGLYQLVGGNLNSIGEVSCPQ